MKYVPGVFYILGSLCFIVGTLISMWRMSK
jgi:hypothetical protein